MLRALIDTSRELRGASPILDNLPDFGNMLSASIPTLLARLDEVLARQDLAPLMPGDRLILVAAGIAMQQRAGHLARGHAVIEW
jgi:3-oxoacyl-[acyl-carrier-protein] synthase III